MEMVLFMSTGISILLLASIGQIMFSGVFLLLLIGIMALPKRLIGQEDGVPPWWRNVRFWAVLICAVQVVVYWVFG